jgi:hypothetical protein
MARKAFIIFLVVSGSGVAGFAFARLVIFLIDKAA